MQNFRSYSSFGSSRNQSDRLSLPRVPGLPSRCSNCFACGKFGHGRSERLQVSPSAIFGSKGFSGNKLLVVDNKSKFDISFVNPPCDVVEVDSKDSVQEPRNFELEADLNPVPSSVDRPQVSVKEKLNSSFHHWQCLGAPQFILNVFRCGYKIPSISTPPSRGITRTLRQLLMKQNLLGMLSWSFCATIVLKKYFLRLMSSIPSIR